MSLTLKQGALLRWKPGQFASDIHRAMTPVCVAPFLVILLTSGLVHGHPKPDSPAANSTSPILNSTEASIATTLIYVTETQPDDLQQSTTPSQETETHKEENNQKENQQNEEVTVVTEVVPTQSAMEFNVTGNNYKLRQAVVHSSNWFALKLYKVVRPKEGNVLLSPLSIGVSLSMLWLGAAEKSALQIAQALNLPEKRTDVTLGFHNLFQSLQKGKRSNITLDVANKLYAHNTFMLNQEFHSTIRKSFLADAELLNFVAEPDVARVSINKWVEQHTQCRIKELLQKDMVSIDTKVVIVNAVYFKGLWKNQFMKEHTHDMPFHVANGSTVSVPTMLAIGDFPTAVMDHLNSTVIKMPYEGSISLLVILPQSQQGLPALEEQLTLQDIEDIIPKLESIELHLSFPKFTLEYSTELENAFKQLGIEDIFETNADLSGISSEKGLSVTHFLHKTFLEVTEEGSEASAATGAVLDIRGGTLSIMVNHPFMFAIRDDKTGAILFLGNYRGPQ